MKKCESGMRSGLLGEHLGHSYSPQIHALLGSYEYKLYEKAPDEVESFIKNGKWDGINVTIPYKKVAASLCDELSDIARKLGSANTLVRKNGKIYGYNTDYYGFMSMVERSEISVNGKKAIVLGSGGASVTVCAVLESLGAGVTVISRSGEDNYSNLSKHADAEIIVNTTPVGMYPKNGESAIDLRDFPNCKGVFDLIYNPLRTKLILQAEELGIPHKSGLHMLVAQAKKSSELFRDTTLDDELIEYIEERLSRELRNIILIGMPGSGKSVVAQAISRKIGREIIEVDAEIERIAGKTIPEIFASGGESEFRAIETEVLAEAGKQSGKIISTGGGCVTIPENYPLLHQNGVIIRIKRDVAVLPTDGRPISQSSDMTELARKREPMYRRFADFEVDNDGSLTDTAEEIVEKLLTEY